MNYEEREIHVSATHVSVRSFIIIVSYNLHILIIVLQRRHLRLEDAIYLRSCSLEQEYLSVHLTLVLYSSAMFCKEMKAVILFYLF